MHLPDVPFERFQRIESVVPVVLKVENVEIDVDPIAADRVNYAQIVFRGHRVFHRDHDIFLLRVCRNFFQAGDERGKALFVHGLVGILHVCGAVERQKYAVGAELRGGVYRAACKFNSPLRGIERI